MAENKTPVTMKVKDFAEREVLLVNYDFSQETDREGQVSGIPRGGRLKIRVKALNDGNPELLGWMLSPNDPRDVEIAFENTVDGKAMKSLKGTGCYCVHYKEYWGDGEEHYEEVTIRKSPSFARSWRTDPLFSKMPGNKIHTIGTQRPEAHRFRLFSFQIKPSAAICVKKENID